MIIGQNPGTNHPRMLITLEESKRKGAKIVSVNPLKEPGLVKFKNPQGTSMISSTQLSDIYLQVKINQDVALLKALMKTLLDREEKEGGVLDHDFIKDHTAGWETLKADLQKQDLEELIDATGLKREDILATADLLAKHERIIICWAMGITQHKNAVGNIQEIVNLLLMKGSIGKKGAGTCPVRGHSNVQGDRTVGIWERPKPEFLDNLKLHFNFEPPRKFGYDSVESIEALAEGKAKVFFAMGGNFLSATPDTPVTAKGLQQCNLTVHVSTKPNRSHLAHGKRSLILPCLGRTELDIQNGRAQFVSVENSMGVVHQSNGTKKPASDKLKSEVRIVCEMAQEVLNGKSEVKWADYANNYDLIRDAIEAVVPGFDNYNKRVREPGGFYLPNGPREGRFTTKDEKAHFTINKVSELKLEEGQYLMTTIRSHDQFNTTIYGLDDRYRGIYNERRVVMMNRDDMKAAGLNSKDVVNLQSHFEGEVREVKKFIVVPYDIPRQCVATYFPEANPLVQVKNKADISNTPASKSVVVTIVKS
jgi:molybdopterin-dependent oxidoreductase alpha subunit